MAVRKRIWKTRKGETQERWVVDYVDGEGTRRQEHCKSKKAADARHAEVVVDIKAGVHIAPSKSPTVREAGEAWLEASGDLERGTLLQYRQHLNLHIVPHLGRIKLAEFSPPMLAKFEADLRRDGCSPSMVRKVRTSLGSILAHAQSHGMVARNIVRELGRLKRTKRNKADQKRKLEVGVDIPTPAEISAILAHAPTGRWRPLLLVAAFTGLRASELRGLRWSDVDLKRNELHVRQRADRFNNLDKPKSTASERTIPFGNIVANTLKEWKLACPKGDLGLVFPNGVGKVDELANIINRGLIPAQIKAGIVTKDGKAKYTGLHALRHFYTSWCINRKVDGGRELPPKTVQARLGHSSITLTLDRYGHLFPAADDSEIDAAELALVSATQTRHAG
jgi:integrase